MAYRFPKSLDLLECYLKQRGADTSRIYSDRHALDVLRKATGFKVRFPQKGKSCYEELRRLHRRLFPNVPMKKAPARARRIHGLGKIGPASACRTVTPEIQKMIVARTADEKA